VAQAVVCARGKALRPSDGACRHLVTTLHHCSSATAEMLSTDLLHGCFGGGGATSCRRASGGPGGHIALEHIAIQHGYACRCIVITDACLLLMSCLGRQSETDASGTWTVAPADAAAAADALACTCRAKFRIISGLKKSNAYIYSMACGDYGE
jgi:hypothetical protein